jgi:ParB-like chromosome segregation protein Spo0J
VPPRVTIAKQFAPVPLETSAATQAPPFHPLASIFPVLKGVEFEELVEDIRVHGVREPIWLFEEQLLDGRNRYRAAQVAGVPCPTRIYDGDDPVGFVVSLNLKRRHLSAIISDRARAHLARPEERSRSGRGGADRLGQRRTRVAGGDAMTVVLNHLAEDER